MTTDRQIARWRLRSQHLAGGHADTAAEVVGGLLAVQAENPGQAAWAVASRTVRREPHDLEWLLEAGHVVRTHVLRPTWHFVAADDVGWLLELTAPRIRPVFLRQLRDGHGMDGAELERASGVVLDALGEQPDQTREQVAAHLHDRGIEPSGQLMMLLLGLLEVEGLVCSGRPAAGTHTYARFADRVPAARQRDRDEALAELALRYFTGHGPATERDLAYWATLPLGDVRRGRALLGNELDSFEHAGRTFWHAADIDPPPDPLAPAGHLLQILDEIYRGYQDSRMVLDSAGIVPPDREAALGMALVDAQMVGRVRRTTGRRLRFELTPYAGTLSSRHREAVEQAAARYGSFLGLEHELVVDAAAAAPGR